MQLNLNKLRKHTLAIRSYIVKQKKITEVEEKKNQSQRLTK